MAKKYVALTGDLVNSRDISRRRVAQNKLIKTAEAINKNFKESIAVKFSITIGDEFQGLISVGGDGGGLDKSYDVCRFAARMLYPFKIAFGVGYGGISTDIRVKTAEMDGECFSRSREALIDAKKNGRSIVYLTGNKTLDISVNTIIMLCDVIKNNWRDLHYRRIWKYEDMGTLEAVARSERVSFQMVDKSLKAARYGYIAAAEKNLKMLLGSISTLQG